jgi:hypothetical protein
MHVAIEHPFPLVRYVFQKYTSNCIGMLLWHTPPAWTALAMLEPSGTPTEVSRGYLSRPGKFQIST